MLWIEETPDGILFKVTVQPRSASNEIVGLRGDALKIKLTAPPIEGAANRVCVAFLAQSLKVKKSDVQIIRGQRSRTKKVLVQSVTRKQIGSLLEA